MTTLPDLPALETPSSLIKGTAYGELETGPAEEAGDGNQPSLQPSRQPTAASRPSTSGPILPTTTPYPPPFDPTAQVRAPAQQERPISDVRAVLVEIV